MKIAQPPLPWLGSEPNICKQVQVTNLVLDGPFGADQFILGFDSLRLEDLLRAHEAAHVEQVTSRTKPNGFGNTDSRYVAHALQSCGAMYGAAKAAVLGVGDVLPGDGIKCAFAPVSGFHHAGYNNCGGYCTFNGLMIAAHKLRNAGLLPQGLLIIDGDGHYGDGTDDIITATDAQSWVTHVSLDKRSVSSAPWVARKMMHEALCRQYYSLVMYQAGADAHRDDPYGVGYLNDHEWAERDMLVFSTCKELDLPVVWNLAGGYNGNKTLTLHCRTFMAALQVFYPTDARVVHKRIPVSEAQVQSHLSSGQDGPSGTAEPQGL